MEKAVLNDAPDTSPGVATPASAPFDNSEADLIIRTSDNVEYRVNKLRLRDASSCFADMLALPALVSPKSGMPIDVVDVAEPSATWEYILRITYATPPLKPIPHGQLWQLFQAAKKYDMPGVRWALGQVLAGIPYTSEENTLRAYILAYTFSFPDIASAAARASLSQPREAFVPELHLASSAVHFRWTEYRRACVDAATAFARNKNLFYLTEWWGKIEGWGHAPSQPQTSHPGPACPPAHTYNARLGGTYVRRSLDEYMKQSGAALQLCPTGATVRGPQLVAALVQDALGCPQCAPNMRSDRIADFVEFYSAKIDEAVAKVSTFDDRNRVAELTLDFDPVSTVGSAEHGVTAMDASAGAGLCDTRIRCIP